MVLATVLAACQPAGAPDADVSDAATPLATDAPDGGDTAPEPPGAADKQVPQLQIATLDGTSYDLAAHRGNWVVVNFWATWCAPCLKEMPELSALDAMHEHIEVIGLAYEDIEVEAMRDFLDAHPVVYPIAIVDTYDPPADFETPRGLPMTYLIAPDGTVAKQVVGPVTAREIEAAIAAAGGPAADVGSNEAGTDEANAAQPS
ncbi:TlpA disulfide reductase family protein [Novilysobacter erysipheiresistens]